MTSDDVWEETETIIGNYVLSLREELAQRWKNWPLDLSELEKYEVVGALLARQVTLVAELALSPGMWNVHMAPLVLRSMADNYITLAWIFGDPLDRARKFVMYGLGQEKLQLEHLKARLTDDGQDATKNDEVIRRERWIDAQQYGFLTEVNLGSWSGIDTRTMADEAGCLEFYNYSFQPFSSVSHNMWNHVGKFNLVSCPNPLHRYHKMPIARSSAPDLNFLLEAALYAEKAFGVFDDRTKPSNKPPSARQEFLTALDSFGNSLPTAAPSGESSK